MFSPPTSEGGGSAGQSAAVIGLDILPHTHLNDMTFVEHL